MENREIFIDLPPRELSIIASLNKHDVRYLIVGGYAMLFHGDEDRLVNDLDIWIDNEKENARRCFDALQEVLQGLLCLTSECLSVSGKKIDLRGDRYDAEIFTSMEGAEFEESFLRRNIFDHNSEPLCFIGAMDLLAIKRHAYDSCRERMEKEGRDIAFLESIVHA